MNRQLYARNRAEKKLRRSKFTPNTSDIRTAWEQEAPKKKKKKLSGLAITLILAIVFFVVAVGITIFSFQTGRNVVSPENIDIVVKGPISTKGGEEITLQLEKGVNKIMKPFFRNNP